MVAAYDHPVVRIAQSILQYSQYSNGDITVDDDGLTLLAFALRKHGKDEALPAAIVALYEVAAALVARAPETAQRILEVIVAVRRDLPVLAAVRQRRAAQMLQTLPVKPRLPEPPPKGSVKAHSFSNPGMQRPRQR